MLVFVFSKNYISCVQNNNNNDSRRMSKRNQNHKPLQPTDAQPQWPCRNSNLRTCVKRHAHNVQRGVQHSYCNLILCTNASMPPTCVCVQLQVPPTNWLQLCAAAAAATCGHCHMSDATGKRVCQ